jgi:hypothetical protein
LHIIVPQVLLNKNQLTKKWGRLVDPDLEMQKDLRLNCESILNESFLWSLDLNYFRNDSEFAEICEQSFNIERFEDNFHSVFIKRKFKDFNRSKQ